MGSASSRTARRYPKPSRLPTEATNKPRLADSHRTKEIEQDARDPDFLANLGRLGPVRVNHPTETMRPIDPMGSTTHRLFESRAKPEFEASSPHLARNHLYSSTLTELLNQRKSAHTQKDLEKLSKEFGIESDKLESLVRFVTSPSVISTEMRSDKDGEGSMTTAVWIEPCVKL